MATLHLERLGGKAMATLQSVDKQMSFVYFARNFSARRR
jgi:hypothetical protein